MNGYLSNLVTGNDLGAWDPDTSYVRKDVCSWGGLNWMALASNTNTAPPSAPWKLFLDPSASVSVTLEDVYPVGSVYTSVVSTNPAILFGIGTWTAFAAGRVLVGVDTGQTEFDTVEETGGAKTHTLTTQEMPSHTHIQDAHTHTQNSHNHTQDPHTHGMLSLTSATGSVASYEHGTVDASSTASAESGAATGSTTATNQATTAVNQNATAVNQNTGGGGAHNNLQPYIVVYMWKRTS